ncbi:hypothetical protein [Oxynema aestuarii]|uniref:Uncharacterized protein n=1 Tax=Oxynema aestuarii AP17 TaxID=2064643 RepID=A0A6H1U2F0_9CYAN|nr:hypothetical protein [Oxynema aestuarii]QIZ73001.1 hypothetical protein HCG48_22325 [Oxynema aestuarii AP17]
MATPCIGAYSAIVLCSSEYSPSSRSCRYSSQPEPRTPDILLTSPTRQKFSHRAIAIPPLLTLPTITALKYSYPL